MTAELRRPKTPAARKSGEVIRLRSRANYKPDVASLAREQVALARRRLGLDFAGFAAAISSALGWAPSPEQIENWETETVPPGDVMIAAGIASRAAADDITDLSEFDPVTQIVGRQFADLAGVYPTRAEFTSRVPPDVLFDQAKDIRAAGLSLNLLCQLAADDDLRAMITTGGRVRCLFLDPAGECIKMREREEGYRQGHLSALTDMNIQILVSRVRDRLPEDVRDRLSIATYDEIIRFNVVIVDSTIAVVQPYMYGARGVESPTFVLNRHNSAHGLFPTFEQTFAWLAERSVQL